MPERVGAIATLSNPAAAKLGQQKPVWMNLVGQALVLNTSHLAGQWYWPS